MGLKKLRPGRRRGVSILALIGLVASLCGSIGFAATTVSPTFPGSPPVVRDTAVTITTQPMAVQFSRSSATAAWSVTSAALTACRGDTGPIGTSGTGNNSPRTGVKVTGPGGITLLDALSPARDVGLSGALGGYPPLNPQPAPGASNYRGSPTSQGAPTGSFVNTVNLAGKPAGIYTVTTTTQNMFRQGTIGATCQIGTAVSGSTAAASPGVQLDTQTFEYRPWQHVFTDVFDGGGVNMNITPKEFQARVNGVQGTIYNGGANMKLYALGTPGSDPLPFALPSDPAGCASNPASCLPSTAIECPQASATCVPRLVVINRGAPGDVIQGIFDLQTKAFIARANVRNNQRVLMSLGTANDAIYKGLLAQLSAQAASRGVDLMSILGTKVRVRLGRNELSLSLLNGLQISPNSKPNGVQIVSDFTVQAGVLLNIYSKLDLAGPACATNVGDSDPATPAPDRYKAKTDSGYTVARSDLLPSVPKVGAVGALVGGPIYNIKGDFVSTTPALLNTSTGVIAVDTAADEPNGYPVWLPLVSGAHTTVARTMDFIGTATWSASETPLSPAGGCLTVDFMLGAGVALYNNPLPVSFSNIPIWDANPAAAGLIGQIDAAVADIVGQVTSNPQVAALLEQITGALPETDLPI